MIKRELEGQLRRVHPYRARSRRRRRAMAPAKRRMQAVLGILFGLGLVALLGAVQLATQGSASMAAGQRAAWGRTHKSASAAASRHTSSRTSFFPKRKRAYNPHHDPRTRRAEQRRRAMFWH